MRPSPRTRRLRSDYRRVEQLKSESSILDFTVQGDPPEFYVLRFFGKGFWRPEGSQEVLIREQHEVAVTLRASYPRMQPELAWRSPIFHPNISAGGVVCLGGYGAFWVPSVKLDELCTMLWDMIRYENFDVESPYNRQAATWVKTECRWRLPVDPRPLRDRLAGVAPAEHERKPPIAGIPRPSTVPDVRFIEPEIVEAEVVQTEESGIFYIQ